jgi:hypothetical protein
MEVAEGSGTSPVLSNAIMEEAGGSGTSPVLSGATMEEAVRSRQVQIGSKRMELRMRGNEVSY